MNIPFVGGVSTEVASSPDDKKTKKNRCTTCKKKLGLTGNYRGVSSCENLLNKHLTSDDENLSLCFV